MLQTKLRLPPLPSVRDLVKLYRLRAIKQLSQNFLLDERITDKFVRAAGNVRDHYVCEVGPGPGSITRSIVKKAPKKLIVVEKDSRFVPSLELLQESCKPYTDMHIEVGDILTYNLEHGLIGAQNVPWHYDTLSPIHLIGNLPFSISTALIIKWLEHISQKSSAWTYGRTPMTLTFQKEVGERMIANNNEKQRCRLSVMCQLWCNVEYKFTIPGTAFVPKPDVDVAVVTLVPLKKPLIDIAFKTVEKVVRAIFNTRQKYCIRGIERLFPEPKQEKLSKTLLLLSEVKPTARPFQLTNEEFVRICYAYKCLCDEHPHLEEYDFRMPKAMLEDYMKKFQSCNP
ncbi:dimethyladenosine transferase 1, mitochondrial [Anthonomus grandis grandis]|uniref:dimethyladenosine transferase 1, mitochondrial n=1 Tax=Anthonomus grandis grandis TaxID=2921223 RepID=UPI0021652849|nr:dimethyladenosine transferase 1, mitochondrial [Anthonomus grandis grandis]